MKLSEAIRKGSKKTRPIKNQYLYRNLDGEVCACALGAALVAAKPHLLRRKNMPRNDEAYEMVKDVFTLDELLKVIPPMYSGMTGYSDTVIDQILRLNDSYEMEREDIADLLEAKGL